MSPPPRAPLPPGCGPPPPLPFAGRPVLSWRPPALPLARASSFPRRPSALRGGLAGLGGWKPRPINWSRSESLMSSSIVRRRRLVGRIGEETAARLLQFFQPAPQQLGVARRLRARRGQRIAELGQRLFLEGEPGLQL